TLVRGADRSGGRLRRSAVDACLNGVRAIEERVRAVADHRAPAAVPDELLDSLAAEDASSEPAGPMPPIAPAWDDRLAASEKSQLFHALRAGNHAYTIEFVPSDAKAAAGMTIATVRARLGALGDIVKVAPRSLTGGAGVAFDILLISAADAEALTLDGEISRVEPIVPPPETLALVEEEETEPTLQRAVVRVELERLDQLQDQLSALVVSRFRLEREIARIAAAGQPVRTLREISDVQARQLRDLRRAILRARLVRLTEVLEPLSLIARNASRTGGTEVKLELDTAGSELDKAVADRLLPAIVHLVRNAVDHGLEPTAERTAAGKPAAGTIRVTGRELPGARLSIAISDDGRGIDRVAVAKRAGRAVVDDQDALDLLAASGFSTREVATRTSGRGVGMDVVKRIATELGGELSMATRPGEGTTFTMTVPLTIALVDGLAFACGQQTFVAPIAAIEEIFELGETIAPASHGTRNAATLIERRGRVVSVVSLGALLAIDAGTGARKALLIRRSGDLLAFAIDRTIGRYEVVVRPILDPLARAPGISGATDLGDGRPTLVLDLNELGATLTSGDRPS
ncbi:MAG: chemotaxis protein CheW, partial [Deltaproteobacteria bacterium]|nr:chemotaxis protein CheW [Deltaproteobacteria bacterium]